MPLPVFLYVCCQRLDYPMWAAVNQTVQTSA
jgi:hypothetical protein